MMEEHIDLTETQRIIEAVLFAAGYPVPYTRLSDILGIGVSAVKKIVKEYANSYTATGNIRGIQLVLYDKSCQLCTKEAYQEQIKDALGIKRGGMLSNSSLEVLAIIAYHQPVTRAYMEQIRGVDCSYAVSNLLDKHLIDVNGRLDVPGRPFLYATTEDFLRCFGLSSLEELPELELFGREMRDEQIEMEMEDTV